MEKIKSSSKFEITIGLQLTEMEARALDAITLYGTEEFLKCFYQNLGKAYLQPHEEGIKSLFETIKNELPKHLKKVDKTRDIWTNTVKC